MHFCVHCGVRVADATNPNCPSCGAPHAGAAPDGPGADPPDAPATRTHGSLRVGATRLPRWLPGTLAAVLVISGAALAVQATQGPDTPSITPSAGDVSLPTTPSESDDTDYTDDSTDSSDSSDSSGTDDSIGEDDDYTSGDDTSSPDSSYDSSEDDSDADSAGSVVETYYDYINDENFSAAWDIGGSNIGGDSYEKWEAGFGSTVHTEVTIDDDEGGDGKVNAEIRSTHDDGTVQNFTGSYTVENGEIVSADIDAV